jgi:hypothetical protein
LSAGICALVFLLAATVPVKADTGTYQILDYLVSLEPQSSGKVRITYEQEWEVLSGNIPWITVGLPNSSFSVEEFSGAASRVYANNSGNWYGVRVDLDKDYLPGETFRVKFVVLQGDLLERLTSENKWRINYTPGWYDRAVTEHLQISLVSPVDLESYSSVEPLPASTGNKIITWERFNIPPGGKLTIRVECLDGSFLSATAEPVKKGISGWPIIILIAIGIAVVMAIVLAVRRNRQVRDEELKTRIAAAEKAMAEDKVKKAEIEKGFREYVIEEGIEPDTQGRYYDRDYGDYITPAIWAAVIMGQQREPSTAGRSHMTCACACVACACACACACAGGGAAGCSKKSLHECRRHLRPIHKLYQTG